MRKGFTVVELLVVILVLSVGSWLYFSTKASENSTERDSARKTSINAMYYNLEEVYYPAHGYYPDTISSKVLRAMDPSLFTDPEGTKLGDGASDFRYSPAGCDTNGHCKSYTLSSHMEKEADYTKTNRDHNN